MTHDIPALNAAVNGKSAPETIAHLIDYAKGRSEPAIVSTNFRPHEAVILHLVTRAMPDIPVLWVDHGYNTPQTYKNAKEIIDLLSLNIHLYIPKRTRTHRDTWNRGVPAIEDKEAHDAFTAEVKLEPFQRGLDELAPSVWFTALRREQTANRQGLATVSPHTGNVLKISPILDWTEADMDAYLAEHNLPSEDVYHDPTKVIGNRECGLHTIVK